MRLPISLTVDYCDVFSSTIKVKLLKKDNEIYYEDLEGYTFNYDRSKTSDFMTVVVRTEPDCDDGYPSTVSVTYVKN